MFGNVSSEQLARLVSIVALIFGVSADEANTTIHVISVIVIGVSELFGFAKRAVKGDLKLGFMRKENVKLGVVRK